MKKIYILLLFIVCIFLIGCTSNSEKKGITFIELDYDSTAINIGETDYIPINYDGIGDYSDLLITSSSPIIEIDNDNIIGLDAGTAIIKISNQDESITVYFTVNVNDNNNYKKSILRFGLNTNGLLVGKSLDLKIDNMKSVGANSIEEFTFSVSDETILEITSDYKIKALKNGQAQVYVKQIKYPSNVGETTVYVGLQSNDKTTSGEPDNTPLIAYFEDDNFIIDASKDEQLFIENANNQQRYHYSCIDEDVLMISDTGLFMGIQPGKATVTITSKDASSTITSGKVIVEVTGYRKRDYIPKLLEIALAEEGYRELTNNNDTKFGEWNYCNYEAWCATFVSWCANNAGISKHIIPRSISVNVFQNNFKKMNRFFLKADYTPVPGDLIIFGEDGASHIGIVVRADDENVYTIEGNTSNMVAQRTYALDYHEISGYCHPNYDLEFN